MQEPPQKSQQRERMRARVIRNYVVDDHAQSILLETVEQASRICDTPVALISLLDSNRQWFKTTHLFGTRDVALGSSICARAVEYDGVFIVPDALVDPRINSNAWVVGNPNVRFYAGAPLITPEGYGIGTVCVLDNRPRSGLSKDQLVSLQTFATRVMTCLDRQRLGKKQPQMCQIDIESTMFASRCN